MIVIQDVLQPCPYLPGIVARMPLRLPIGKVTPALADGLLALGYRRSGDFVYRTQCPSCCACEPTRVIVNEFQWTTSLRRVLKRGDQSLEMLVGPPQTDSKRVALFNVHRQVRELARDDATIDEEGYRGFLVDSCCETVELSFWMGDRLVGVSIVDQAADSLSAVYTFFDPEHSKLSVGSYAILKQIELAIRSDRKYLYLGMYVAENQHLNYKAKFAPQERFNNQQWARVPNI